MELGLSLSRPDSHTYVVSSVLIASICFNVVSAYSNKAVAEGAVSFYLEHFVSVRMARVTYGTSCVRQYDPADPEHHILRGRVFTQASGQRCIPGAFSVLLPKVSIMRN